MSKKKKKNTATQASASSGAPLSPLTDKETEENMSASIARDICETIRSSEKEAAKNVDSVCMTNGRVNFRGFLTITAFGILLYWALNHFGLISGGIRTVLGIFSPIIMGLAIAFIINAVLSPLERLWTRLINPKELRILCRLKRPFCLILATIIVIGVICAVIFMLIPELKSTFTTFAEKLPGLLSKLEALLLTFTEFLTDHGIPVSAPDTWFTGMFTSESIDSDKLIETVYSFLTGQGFNNFISEQGKNVLNTTVGITTSLFSSVFNTVLALVFAFYVLAQKEKVGHKLKSILYALFPKRCADRTLKIATLTNRTFMKFVTGQFTEAVIIGVLCFIGMLILRMPYAAVISVLVGATALIPLFGAFIGTAVGAVLILSVSFMKAIWFIVFIIVLQQFESNLIYPKVVGKSLGLPGILVLAAVTVGGGMFGFIGVLLGVPVCSVLYSIFSEFTAERLRDKKITLSGKEQNSPGGR